MKALAVTLAIGIAAAVVAHAPASPAHAQLSDVLNALSSQITGSKKQRRGRRVRGSDTPILAHPPVAPVRNPRTTGEELASSQPIPTPPKQPRTGRQAKTVEAETTGPQVTLPIRQPAKQRPELKAQANNAPESPGDSSETTAPPPPPDKWDNDQIVEAFARCEDILKKIAVTVKPAKPVRKGQCGMPGPVVFSGLGDDNTVSIKPAATLNCRTVAAIHTWIENTVQPAARKIFNSSVVRIRNVSSYSCRNRNNAAQGRLSEHAYGNALDIAGFELADGRTVSVLDDWGIVERDQVAQNAEALSGNAKTITQTPTVIRTSGPALSEPIPIPVFRGPVRRGVRLNRAEEQKSKPSPKVAATSVTLTKFRPSDKSQFLKRVHKSACGIFGTVLGPEANDAHRDHFHLDTAQRNYGAYCR